MFLYTIPVHDKHKDRGLRIGDVRVIAVSVGKGKVTLGIEPLDGSNLAIANIDGELCLTPLPEKG